MAVVRKQTTFTIDPATRGVLKAVAAFDNSSVTVALARSVVVYGRERLGKERI